MQISSKSVIPLHLDRSFSRVTCLNFSLIFNLLVILINKYHLCRQARLLFCALNKRFLQKRNQNIIYTIFRMSATVVIAYRKNCRRFTIHVVYLHFPVDATMFEDIIEMCVAWNRQKLLRAF